MKTHLTALTITLLLAVSAAEARWVRPYTDSGFPEITINTTNRALLENAITNAYANIGCLMTQQQGASLTYECSKEWLNYRERIQVSLMDNGNGTRVIIRNFFFLLNGYQPGSINAQLGLNPIKEMTHRRKFFEPNMVFLESLKEKLESHY